MTLVLSMNPFLEPEVDPPLSSWESERWTKSRPSSPAATCTSVGSLTPDATCRRLPDQRSKIAYFKRKLVDCEEVPLTFRTYCQMVTPVLEERAHILRLSLEKMRFIDDPEAFLRRSVLVNNLLGRLRAEILLQSSDCCFSPNSASPTAPCIMPPTAAPAHPALRALPPRICLAPQGGPPFRKRFRMVRVGQGDLQSERAQTCCCFYAAAAAAGHDLHLPLSAYDAPLSTCPSTPSSSLLQLNTHSKLGLAVEDHDTVEEQEEDDEVEKEEAGSSVEHKCRTRTSETRTAEETGEEEEELEEEGVTHCQCHLQVKRHTSHLWLRRLHRH
ncbi:SERTA domain-containing protein 4 [Synchiropus splendidus]|uniref:SERTA domain-containing protein 4 n=1 Tax=Synchiropus splendidus TaxID=270530 RepID=UPI00237DADD7|nr:SERTA domain-containing protein 4 [Synchiropus splendidus]